MAVPPDQGESQNPPAENKDDAAATRGRSATAAPRTGPTPEPLADDTGDDETGTPDFTTEEFDVLKRTRAFLLKQQALELTESEAKQEARRQQIEKEAKDERAKILKAVEVTVPDLRAKLVDKIDALSIADHDFAKRAETTLMDLAGIKLREPQEFFDLNPAQRDDLLDRIGFYRGITIDHRLSNPVQVGFRDILRKPDETPKPKTAAGMLLEEAAANPQPTADAPPPETVPAKVLYRKPNFAGYFENYFTSSEAVHQSQKNGVTNLKFSLAVAGGIGTKVGVGVGVGYNEQSQVNDGSVKKKVFITSNFFLPRIELSFENRKPCASADFIEACRTAIESDRQLPQRFAALKKVLDAFGQFAATQTLIGGRLFATETKLFEGTETGSDVTKRFAAEVKASLSTPTVDAQASASAERSKQEIVKDKGKSEEQSATFHAVGGEGGVVQNAAAWTESLMDYRRWSAVQRENLVPSIDLLPAVLAASCWSVIEDYVRTRTKRDLLFDDEAYFVFYGDYGDRLTRLAGETWFVVRNAAWGSALTLSEQRPSDGSAVSLQETVPNDTQVWRMSPDGHLICKPTRDAGAFGKRDPVEFALTIEPEASGAAAVRLRQLGRAPHQTWEYAGSGTFVSRSFGADAVLVAENADRLVVRKRSANAEKSELWDLIEVSPNLGGVVAGAQSAATAAAAEDPDIWFKLRVADSRMLLSVRGGECRAGFPIGQAIPAAMLPDVGDFHQLWRKTADGNFISRMRAIEGDRSEDLYLTLDSDQKLCAQTKASNARQRWTMTTEGYLTPATGKRLAATATSKESPKNQAYGVELAEPDHLSRQLWTIEPVGRDPARPLVELPPSYNELTEAFYSVCSRPIKVDGEIIGIRFSEFDRGIGRSGYVFKPELIVRRGDNFEVACNSGDPEAGSSEETYFWNDDDGDAFVQNTSLYLPPGKVKEFKIAFRPGSRVLTMMVRMEGSDDWIMSEGPDWGLGANANDMTLLAGQSAAEYPQRVVAMGFDRGPSGKRLAARLVTGPRPGCLPMGSILLPGTTVFSPERTYALQFDERRRLVLRATATGREEIIWEAEPGTDPGPGWRMLVGRNALYIIDEGVPIQPLTDTGIQPLLCGALAPPGSLANRLVLEVRDDGDLVLARCDGYTMSGDRLRLRGDPKLAVQAQLR